jgi:hypothetical protein
MVSPIVRNVKMNIFSARPISFTDSYYKRFSRKCE